VDGTVLASNHSETTTIREGVNHEHEITNTGH
jgi:hypothetical protein